MMAGEGDGDGEDQDQDKPDCGCGEVRDYSGEDPEGEKAEWNVAVMQAAIAAQSMGSVTDRLGSTHRAEAQTVR